MELIAQEEEKEEEIQEPKIGRFSRQRGGKKRYLAQPFYRDVATL
jgi:hypothetical protein